MMDRPASSANAPSAPESAAEKDTIPRVLPVLPLALVGAASLAACENDSASGSVELICDDAEHMPYPDDSFDGIFTSFTLELFDTPAIPNVLAECRRVLRPGGRLVVVALSKEGKQGLMLKAYEWTHEHFPNLMDCRPIYVRRSIEAAGFDVTATEIEHMWVPVEIVHAIKPR